MLDTVAAPIEQQVSGVENMLYMSSQCTNDGAYMLTVTFKLGMDSDMAQVLVQNRVSLAMPVIPDLVQRQGINVKKKSPSTMMIVNLISDDADGQAAHDDLYLSNYATIQIKDELAGCRASPTSPYLGERDYSMRVWLDPEQAGVAGPDAPTTSSTPSASRTCRWRPARSARSRSPPGQAFQFTINTLGRLIDAEQFGDIIVKVGQMGRTARHRRRPAARRGPARTRRRSSTTSPARWTASRPWPCRSTSCPAPTPSKTAQGVYAKMEELKKRFPPGSTTRSSTTPRRSSSESIIEVFKTLRDAIILVAIVVLVFLQNWRATLIPLIAVPVAIVGTFAVMAAHGLQPQQPVAVRPGAGDRHRGRRRDRGGRERRALAGSRGCRRATRPARRWTK